MRVCTGLCIPVDRNAVENKRLHCVLLTHNHTTTPTDTRCFPRSSPNQCKPLVPPATFTLDTTVLINGPEERTIPGNALSVHPDLPFRGLERFGVSFLSRFEGSQLPSSVLRSVTLIDTPGVLSGEKQRVNRGYDFEKVISWFADVSIHCAGPTVFKYMVRCVHSPSFAPTILVHLSFSTTPPPCCPSFCFSFIHTASRLDHLVV